MELPEGRRALAYEERRGPQPEGTRLGENGAGEPG